MDVGGGEQLGGDSTPDAALREVPVFQHHTERVWNAIVALSPWMTDKPEPTAAINGSHGH